jgi:septal ring factor EnvC (AmiA/AmiB activator)
MENQTPTTNTSSKNWIYLSLIAVLAASTIYLFVSKNKSDNRTTEIGQELATETTAKQAVQDEYNAALLRLDEMKSDNASMDSLLTTKNVELAALTDKIASIVKNKNASDAQLSEAKTLLASLNGKLDVFSKQIATLKAANAQLATEKEQVTSERDAVTAQKEAVTTEKNNIEASKKLTDEKNADLEKKVDLAKVLHASNIMLEPVKKRWIDGKEISTSKAGRTELIHIKFNLDDNRLSESGDKEVYIVIYGPDGNAYGSNKFTISNGTQKIYSASKTIPYTQGQTSKDIALDWKPTDANFGAGEYNVEIYHKGYKIGEQNVRLK